MSLFKCLMNIMDDFVCKLMVFLLVVFISGCGNNNSSNFEDSIKEGEIKANEIAIKMVEEVENVFYLMGSIRSDLEIISKIPSSEDFKKLQTSQFRFGCSEYIDKINDVTQTYLIINKDKNKIILNTEKIFGKISSEKSIDELIEKAKEYKDRTKEIVKSDLKNSYQVNCYNTDIVNEIK